MISLLHSTEAETLQSMMHCSRQRLFSCSVPWREPVQPLLPPPFLLLQHPMSTAYAESTDGICQPTVRPIEIEYTMRHVEQTLPCLESLA